MPLRLFTPRNGLVSRVLSHRIYILVLAHAAVAALIYWLSYQIRFDFSVPPGERPLLIATLPWIVVIKLLLFYRFGRFHGWWSYVTFDDLTDLFRVATLSTLVIAAVDYFCLLSYQIPRAIVVLDWCGTILLFGGLRSIWRYVHEGVWLRFAGDPRKPALLVSADPSSVALARQINSHPKSEYRVVGFLDDRANHPANRAGGIPIVGGPQQVQVLADKYDAEQVLAIAGSTYGDRLRALMEQCRAANIDLKMIPSVDQLVNGTHRLRTREINIDDLLRRDAVRLDTGSIRAMLKARRVMVTGAGGSIGSEICRQIAASNVDQLILVERAENNLFHIEQELKHHPSQVVIAACVADIRDEERMEILFRRHRPEVVFHAAAHKHVPLMEDNPGEAIGNNAIGTQRLAELADRFKVERFVLISTDKAVHPTSVMGTSKQLAERFVHVFSERSQTRFMVVRFGNVLGSVGSVVPIFQEQIRHGGPITVTHADMRRYFMTIPEASQLVLQAAAMGRGGEIFILDMGEPVQIMDLARDMIRLSGLSEDEIEIIITGARPGEKLYEELLLSDEETLPTSHSKLRVARPCAYSWDELQTLLADISQLIHEDSDTVRRRLAELVPDYRPHEAVPLVQSVSPRTERTGVEW